MKKLLLACSFIVSSCFFVYAQSLDIGGVPVSGTARVENGTVNGSVRVGDGQNAVIINTNGQVSGTANVGGVRVNVGNGGGSAGGVYTVGGGGTFTNQGGLLGLLGFAQVVVARLVPFMVGLALLAFFWFLIVFIWKGSESVEEQTKGKKGMIYSIIALFVMVSIWGIIGFMGRTIGVQQGGNMPGFKLPGEQ